MKLNSTKLIKIDSTNKKRIKDSMELEKSAKYHVINCYHLVVLISSVFIS